MQLFTTGQVVRIARLHPNTFLMWCAAGHVQPANEVSGHGNHRIFTLMTVVGVAVAAELRAADRRCSPRYCGTVVDAFAAMDEAELLKRFAKGETHLAAIHQGKPVLDGRRYDDWVDVEAVYRRVVDTKGMNKSR